jgi:hypothetical protein
MSGQALALSMVEIPTNGLSNFTNNNPTIGPPVDPFVFPWPQLGCTRMGDDSPTPPLPFCAPTGSPLTKVIARHGDKVGAIWTIPPVFLSPPTGCLGFQIDSLNTLPEGPTCLAVRAVDNAGNINVTPPVRVCIDRGGGKCVGWNPYDSATWKNCTGKYDKATDTIVAGTCSPFNSSTLINSPGHPYNGLPVFQTRFRRDPLGGVDRGLLGSVSGNLSLAVSGLQIVVTRSPGGWSGTVPTFGDSLVIRSTSVLAGPSLANVGSYYVTAATGTTITATKLTDFDGGGGFGLILPVAVSPPTAVGALTDVKCFSTLAYEIRDQNENQM